MCTQTPIDLDEMIYDFAKSQVRGYPSGAGEGTRTPNRSITRRNATCRNMPEDAAQCRKIPGQDVFAVG
ncbi:hypothetical protein FRAHR75_820002 [Frankia sp. Hr75.2]|nr:hypothetical protein FRAHR75_820002 [Frankia sp. Hr75.2]